MINSARVIKVMGDLAGISQHYREDLNGGGSSPTADRLDAAETLIREMAGQLLEDLEYFENREDVIDGDYGVPAPNKEMKLACDIRDLLGEKPASVNP